MLLCQTEDIRRVYNSHAVGFVFKLGYSHTENMGLACCMRGQADIDHTSCDSQGCLQAASKEIRPMPACYLCRSRDDHCMLDLEAASGSDSAGLAHSTNAADYYYVCTTSARQRFESFPQSRHFRALDWYVSVEMLRIVCLLGVFSSEHGSFGWDQCKSFAALPPPSLLDGALPMFSVAVTVWIGEDQRDEFRPKVQRVRVRFDTVPASCAGHGSGCSFVHEASSTSSRSIKAHTVLPACCYTTTVTASTRLMTVEC